MIVRRETYCRRSRILAFLVSVSIFMSVEVGWYVRKTGRGMIAEHDSVHGSMIWRGMIAEHGNVHGRITGRHDSRVR